MPRERPKKWQKDKKKKKKKGENEKTEGIKVNTKELRVDMNSNTD